MPDKKTKMEEKAPAKLGSGLLKIAASLLKSANDRTKAAAAEIDYDDKTTVDMTPNTLMNKNQKKYEY